jgi:hypothetical protein
MRLRIAGASAAGVVEPWTGKPPEAVRLLTVAAVQQNAANMTIVPLSAGVPLRNYFNAAVTISCASAMRLSR